MKFIYESPDGGKTVYRAPIGSDVRQLMKVRESSLSLIETIVTTDGHVINIVDAKSNE